MDQDFFSNSQPFILTVVGLITLGISLFRKSGNSMLKQNGIPVEGIVFRQEFDENVRQSYDNSFSPVKDKITIRFLTNTNEWITGVIKQDFRLFYTGQFKDGETIKVYYNKDNPSDFYVDTKQSEFVGRLFIASIGLVFLLIGLYQVLVN